MNHYENQAQEFWKRTSVYTKHLSAYRSDPAKIKGYRVCAVNQGYLVMPKNYWHLQMKRDNKQTNPVWQRLPVFCQPKGLMGPASYSPNIEQRQLSQGEEWWNAFYLPAHWSPQQKKVFPMPNFCCLIPGANYRRNRSTVPNNCPFLLGCTSKDRELTRGGGRERKAKGSLHLHPTSCTPT